MIPKVFRAAIALTSTALIVPYAVAFITELLYGKSTKSHNRYLRALHPYRVFALNLALLSTLKNLKYTKLYLKWSKYYKSLSLDRVVKDISFGQNQNTLDIYKPLSLRGTLDDYRLKPVVVFIYGGNWGSGDKNMYSLLCSNIADNFNCLVVCPNYSTYPKGFVDDMVQDVSDALQWVKSNAVLYGGDKSRIALVGHSAGGHLAALTVFELYLRCLGTSPDALESFVTLEKDKGLPLEVSFVKESTFVREVGSKKVAIENRLPGAEVVSSAEVDEVKVDEVKVDEVKVDEVKVDEVTDEVEVECRQISEKIDHENCGDENGMESFVLVNPSENNKVLEEFVTTEMKGEEQVGGGDDDDREEVKPSIDLIKADKDCSLLKSIKVVIGLAGVYDIKKHYDHESRRAIEHYSTMSKAMYDDDNNFDNFSPALVLNNIPNHVKLPAFHLMHGTSDKTVPPSSSLSFAECLRKRGVKGVHVSMFVDCNHVDICLDTMDEERRWYGAVMNEFKKAFKGFLL